MHTIEQGQLIEAHRNKRKIGKAISALIVIEHYQQLQHCVLSEEEVLSFPCVPVTIVAGRLHEFMKQVHFSLMHVLSNTITLAANLHHSTVSLFRYSRSGRENIGSERERKIASFIYY